MYPIQIENNVTILKLDINSMKIEKQTKPRLSHHLYVCLRRNRKTLQLNVFRVKTTQEIAWLAQCPDCDIGKALNLSST